MAQVARRHHTVPKFYLEQFARAGRIGTVRLPGDRRFVQSTANAAARTDFYALPEHEDGPDVFEKSLSDVEGAAAGVMGKVLRENTWPLGAEDRATLATFLVVQSLRGPDQRRQMEQIVALTTQLEIGFGGRDSVAAWAKRNRGLHVTAEQADKIWDEAVQPGGPPIKLSAAGHIKQLVRTIPEIYPYIAGRPWVLIRFARKHLYTCDTPLSLIPDYQAPDLGVGLATAWGITFPLTRTAGLLLANPRPVFGHATIEEVSAGTLDYEDDPSTAYANWFNGATVLNAREWLFHHPDDADTVPAQLPEPKLVEITAAVPDFGDRR